MPKWFSHFGRRTACYNTLWLCSKASKDPVLPTHTSMVPFEFTQSPKRFLLAYPNIIPLLAIYWVFCCPAQNNLLAKRETKQPWNSKSVFTLSVVKPERNKKKKVKKAAAFRHYLVFLYFSYLVFCHGVFWSNDTQPTKPNQTKPNQTKPNNQQHFVMMMCKYCYILSTTNLKWVWHLIIQIKKSKKSISC